MASQRDRFDRLIGQLLDAEQPLSWDDRIDTADMLRDLARSGRPLVETERIVQITQDSDQSDQLGLSNLGRVWALSRDTNMQPRWELVIDNNLPEV